MIFFTKSKLSKHINSKNKKERHIGEGEKL